MSCMGSVACTARLRRDRALSRVRAWCRGGGGVCRSEGGGRRRYCSCRCHRSYGGMHGSGSVACTARLRMPLMFCAIARPMVSWIARQCAHVVVSAAAAAAAALGLLPGFRRFLPELLPEQPSLSSSSSSTASDRPGRGLPNMRMPTLEQLIGPTQSAATPRRASERTRVGYPGWTAAPASQELTVF